jgi:polysaccharide transporter, PST family
MIRLSGTIRRAVEGRPMLKRILDNITWLFLDKVARLGMGLVVGIWVARYLGPQQYGLLNFGVATVALFGIFVRLGLQSIVVRDLVNDPGGTGVTIGTAAVLQVLGAVLAYTLLAFVITYLRPDDELARLVVLLLGLTLFMKAFDTATYWFEAKVISKYLVWMSNTVFLILSAVKVVLILTGAPLLAFVWVTVADAVIVGIGSVVLFLKIWPGGRLLRFDGTRARGLFSDSWPLFLSSAAVVVYMKIDMVMLAQMAGDEAAGIYAAATKVSEPWYFIPTIIVASVFPSIIKTKKRQPALYYQRLQRLFDLMIWLAIAFSIPMTFLSGALIRFLFGADYFEAGGVLAIHIWASIFVFYGLAWSKWGILEGHSNKILYLHVFALLANVALNAILIAPLGAQGAAIATVASYGLGHTVLIYFDRDLRPSAKFFLNAILLRSLWRHE